MLAEGLILLALVLGTPAVAGDCPSLRRKASSDWRRRPQQRRRQQEVEEEEEDEEGSQVRLSLGAVI